MALLWLPFWPIYLVARAAAVVADRRDRLARALIAEQAARAAEMVGHG